MIIRTRDDVTAVNWGNGTSHRLLIERDGMGYTVTDTIVYAGTESRLEYRNHLEACYCVGGSGYVIDTSGEKYEIEPGTIYALDEHDAHILGAKDEDLRLICMFTPALEGTEVHDLTGASHSAY